MKSSKTLYADVAIGLGAGLVATRMAAPIQKWIFRLTPQSVKRREKEVRPGSPTKVAAKKVAAGVDAKLTHEQVTTAATAIHYASGMPWGVFYTFLRRSSGMSPVGAALTTGTSMSLILDEALTPAMGFSAPDRDYPTATHVRGLVAHLLFGAVLAAVAEALYPAIGAAPDFDGETSAGG